MVFDTTHIHQTQLLLTSGEQVSALDRLSNFSFFVPNFLFWLSIFYVGLSIGQQLLRRYSPMFRDLPEEKQRTAMMHIFELFLVTFIIGPQIYFGHTVTEKGLFDPDVVTDVGEPPQWLDRTRDFQFFSGFAVMPLVCGYITSLLYASPRVYLALHHLIVLFLYAAGTLNMTHCTGPDLHVLSVGYWLMYHISTEQLSFAPLILNRFNFNARLVETAFLVSWTFQIVQRAVVHSIFIWIYVTRFAQRRVKLYWDYFWLTVLPPCMLVLLLSQIFVIRVHYSLWRRYRSKRLKQKSTEEELKPACIVDQDDGDMNSNASPSPCDSSDDRRSGPLEVELNTDTESIMSPASPKMQNEYKNSNDSASDPTIIEMSSMNPQSNRASPRGENTIAGKENGAAPAPSTVGVGEGRGERTHRAPRLNTGELTLKIMLFIVPLITVPLAVELIPSACEVADIQSQNVAIIGTGASGLAAAYSLVRNDAYTVDMFESRPVFGGSCQSSYHPDIPGQPMELGVQAFGPEVPLFQAVLGAIGHRSFSNPYYDIDTSSVVRNLTADSPVFTMDDARTTTNFYRPPKVGARLNSTGFEDTAEKVAKMTARLSDMLNRARMLWTKKQLWQTTVGEMVEQDGTFTKEFTRELLSSYLSFLYSSQVEQSGVPVAMLSTVVSMIQMPFTFGWNRHPEDGCSGYMNKFYQSVLDGAVNPLDIHFNTDVTRVEKRDDGTVRVHYNGTSKVYDAVVMTGTYRNWASMLKKGTSKIADEIFSNVKYSETVAMPVNTSVFTEPYSDGCWNGVAYRTHVFRDTHPLEQNLPDNITGAVQTYPPLMAREGSLKCLSKPPQIGSFYWGSGEHGLLDNITSHVADNHAVPGATGYLPDSCGSDPNVKQCKKWLQPTHDSAYFRAGLNLHKLQGRDNIWFAGADTVWNMHEHALASGFVIAHQMGAGFPFDSNVEARRSFYGQYLWQHYGVDRYEITPPLSEQ